MSTGGVKFFFEIFFMPRPWAPVVPTVTDRSAFEALEVAACGRVGSDRFSSREAPSVGTYGAHGY